MAINKNFVVKNGLEVASNLLVANSSLNRVGLGTTTPRTLLDVRGGCKWNFYCRVYFLCKKWYK